MHVEETVMNQVSCECGYAIRDENEDRVVQMTLNTSPPTRSWWTP